MPVFDLWPGSRTESEAGVDRPEGHPRARLESAAVLTDVELVALVLRTGAQGRNASALARLLLDRFGGLAQLAVEPTLALQSLPGLGPVKAASLVAAIELGRRIAATPLERGRLIQGPVDVQRHFQPYLRALRRESFHVLLLDGRNRLIALEAISVGTLTASLVHPREVFREAIRRAAAAMLLVHNHPSGDPTPSAEDREVTRRLQAAGELLGIRIIDHVIVAEAGYYSFREADPSFEPQREPQRRPTPSRTDISES